MKQIQQVKRIDTEMLYIQYTKIIKTAQTYFTDISRQRCRALDFFTNSFKMAAYSFDKQKIGYLSLCKISGSTRIETGSASLLIYLF